jgi:hypothetical protein
VFETISEQPPVLAIQEPLDVEPNADSMVPATVAHPKTTHPKVLDVLQSDAPTRNGPAADRTIGDIGKQSDAPKPGMKERTTAIAAENLSAAIPRDSIAPPGRRLGSPADEAAKTARSAPAPSRMREAPLRFDVTARSREANVHEQSQPDVYIHIHRVELTALTAPAPARKAPSASPAKPMTLEAYLEQRKRKAT